MNKPSQVVFCFFVEDFRPIMPIDLQLLHEPIRKEEIDFMLLHWHDDIATCMLNPNFTPRERLLLKQIHLRQRIEYKLPSIHHNPQWILPEQLNLEQSSSEKTAQYKAGFLHGKILLDVTLGMGIDAMWMSRSFEKVIAVEQDPELAALTEHNLKSIVDVEKFLVIKGQKAEEYLECNAQQVDMIFIDPARRGHGGAKVFQLQDCSPDVVNLLPILKKKTRYVLLKTSPVLDIQQAMHQLQHVRECHVIESEKECKELLFFIDFEYNAHAEIIAINVDKEQRIQSTLLAESNLRVEYHVPQTYIYEPGPGFLKSGLFKTIAAQTNTFKLHPHSHLYTSIDLIENFPGRSFRLLQIIKPNSQYIKKYLPDMQANLTLRNYPGQTKDLAKKLKLKDGGDYYLFATTLIGEEKVLLLCKKC